MQGVSGTAQKRSVDTSARKKGPPTTSKKSDVRVKIDKASTENYGYPVEW